MIYTSYFGNRKIPDNFVKVSISRYSPKGFKGISFPILSPSSELLSGYKNGTVSKEEYIKKFNHYLSVLPKDILVKQLNSLGDNVVLLCYEKPENFCHRHLVAEWMRLKELDNK